MKKKKGFFGLFGLLFGGYILSLFWISGRQNPYLVQIEAKQDYFVVDREQSGEEFWIPILVKNTSFQAIAAEFHRNLSYHLYALDQEEQTLLSIENVRTELGQILPGDQKEVWMRVLVPLESGVYILYVDLVEEGVTWYSEHGTLTKPIVIEVITDENIV